VVLPTILLPKTCAAQIDTRLPQLRRPPPQPTSSCERRLLRLDKSAYLSSRSGEHAKKVTYVGSRGYRRLSRANNDKLFAQTRMLRIKQTNSLDFSTAWSTSPRRLPILPLNAFFMKFRGPQALNNRRRKPIVCPTRLLTCRGALSSAPPRARAVAAGRPCAEAGGRCGT